MPYIIYSRYLNDHSSWSKISQERCRSYVCWTIIGASDHWVGETKYRKTWIYFVFRIATNFKKKKALRCAKLLLSQYK